MGMKLFQEARLCGQEAKLCGQDARLYGQCRFHRLLIKTVVMEQRPTSYEIDVILP